MGNKNTKKEPECIPEMQRLSYDLSVLHDLKIPIIWLVGPPFCGRDTLANTLEDAYGFDVLKVGQLLRKHSSNETDRGRVIKENIDKAIGYIPNTIVLDIMKEEMLYRARWSCGFVINGFPRNKDQAEMFVNEILPVDVIIFLESNLKVLVERFVSSTEGVSEADARKAIRKYLRDLIKGLKKYNAKIEKFNTTHALDMIFPKIQSALNVRVFGEMGNKTF